MNNEFTLGYLLLHLRKSIPYTQEDISMLCTMSMYRYRLLEKNKAIPTKEEWNCLCALYKRLDIDVESLYHTIKLS